MAVQTIGQGISKPIGSNYQMLQLQSPGRLIPARFAGINPQAQMVGLLLRVGGRPTHPAACAVASATVRVMV